MTLGERIKECRLRAGMSQEKLAELVGVSRQAVTKWEADQSAPHTENLFRLAEIFGTTVDMLLNNDSAQPSAAEQIYYLYKMEQEQQKAAFLRKIKQNVLAMLAVALFYGLIYLIGRLLWCDFGDSSILGWLLDTKPRGEGSYLYGWLLSSNMFIFALGYSMALGLSGAYRLAVCSSSYFLIGLLTGMALGPNPAGATLGQSHYGWAYWGAIFLLSLPTGLLWQRAKKNGIPLNSGKSKRLLIGSIAALLLTILAVKMLTL
ncbi:MAG: helix-turn-helix transcriptional regulator [Firmicutes bacterium]|nr:helix-turn-helix transcriptional regulator [Bacillota bacterium]